MSFSKRTVRFLAGARTRNTSPDTDAPIRLRQAEGVVPGHGKLPVPLYSCVLSMLYTCVLSVRSLQLACATATFSPSPSTYAARVGAHTGAT